MNDYVAVGFLVSFIIVATVALLFIRPRVGVPWLGMLRHCDAFGGRREVRRHLLNTAIWLATIEIAAHGIGWLAKTGGPLATSLIYRAFGVPVVTTTGPMTLWSTAILASVAMCWLTKDLVDKMSRNPPVDISHHLLRKDFRLAVEYIASNGWKGARVYKIWLALLAHQYSYFWDREGCIIGGACTLIMQDPSFSENSIIAFHHHCRVRDRGSRIASEIDRGIDEHSTDPDKALWIVTVHIKEIGFIETRSRLNSFINHSKPKVRPNRIDISNRCVRVTIRGANRRSYPGILRDVSVDGRGLAVICDESPASGPNRELTILLHDQVEQTLRARQIHDGFEMDNGGQERHRIGLEVPEGARQALLRAVGFEEQVFT